MELIDIIGVGIVLIVFLELVVLSIKLFMKYTKNTNEKLPLWFSLMFFCLAIGITFLILQQLTFRIIINIPLGRLFTWLALFFVGIAAFFLNWISFELTYPQNKNKLIIPIIITIIILLSSSWIMIHAGDPFSYIQGGEIFYIPAFQIFAYFLVGILCFIAPTVFVYFAIMNKENKSARNRSLWLAFALYLFGVAFMIEVGPIVAIISVPMRAAYIVVTTIMYIQFTRKPAD